MFPWTLLECPGMMAFWQHPPTPVSKCSYKVAAQKRPGLVSSHLNEHRGPRSLTKTLPYGFTLLPAQSQTYWMDQR